MAKERPVVLGEVPRLSHTATCSWQGQHWSFTGKPPPFKMGVYQTPQTALQTDLVPLCQPLLATPALQQGLSLLSLADVGQGRNRKHIPLGSPLVCLHSQAAAFSLHQPFLTPLMIQARNRAAMFTVGLSAAPCCSWRSASALPNALRDSIDTTGSTQCSSQRVSCSQKLKPSC